MIFFKRKEHPTEIDHDTAIVFLKQEIGLNWSQAMNLIEQGMGKDLKHTRIIRNGEFFFRFKSKNIIPYLEKITGIPKRKIRKHFVIAK